MTGANGLHCRHKGFLKSTPQTEQILQDLSLLCKDTLQLLFDTNRELLCRSAHITRSDLEKELIAFPAHDTSLSCATEHFNALWQSLDSQYECWKSFRRESLDRFHRQAFLHSGSGAHKGSLRILQQGISAQVDNLLAMYHKRPHLLGSSGHDRDMVLSQNSIEQPENGNVDSHSDGQQSDFEVFDDSDFYQQLLKEYLEGKELQGTGSTQLVKGNRKRKHINSAFTKDRRLRYTVDDKLVNFMVPTSSSSEMQERPWVSTVFSQNCP